MRDTFVKELEKLCNSDKGVFLLTGDLGFKLFDKFREKHSERFFNMGIAETNMIGVAAGLALSGKNVYCYSMIPFLITRCLEHIKIDVCYHNLNIKLVGVGSGFAYGAEGVTHHAVEDLAILRPLPNMTIVAPGDLFEVSACIEASGSHTGPMFIRLGKNYSPAVHPGSRLGFKIGRGITVLDKGRDICILATGSALHNAKIASDILSRKSYGVTLISMHTIKPLDESLIKDCAKRYGRIITVEEHSLVGGLGSAVAEVLSEISYNGLFKRMGIPDEFSRYQGGRDYILGKYELLPKNIADRIIKFIREK